MKFYSAIVRPAGDINTEVFKDNLTAPEVILLRHLHGDDAVRNVQPVGERNVGQVAERDRLVILYGGNEERGQALLRDVFGPPTVKLPTELDDVAQPTILDDDEPELDRKDPQPVLKAPTKAA